MYIIIKYYMCPKVSPLPLKISNVRDPPLLGYGAQCNQRE